MIETDFAGSAGVGWIRLNRPERRNALNRTLVVELGSALARAEAEERVRAVALRARGPDFCAGADLSEVNESIEAGGLAGLRDAEALGELLALPRKMTKPVVAVVHGRALAGGCGLATSCDMVLAAESARFGYPEVRLGFVPAMVAATLRRNMGEKRAFELMAMSEVIEAAEAARLGLVNRVFPDDDFEVASAGFLAELAGRSASALALSKKLLYSTETLGFEASIAAGAQVNALARLTEDCQAGIRRFGSS